MPDQDERALSESEAGNDNAQNTRSAKTVDYERKYKGEQRNNERLRAELAALQERHDALLGDKAELEARVAHAAKPVQQKLEETIREAAEAKKKAEAYERELNQFKMRESTRMTIREHFPALASLHESGDLRERSEFQDDEAFTNYLQRMSTYVAPQSVTAPAARPPAPTPGANIPSVPKERGSAAPKSLDQIQERLAQLDSLDPKQQSEYFSLLGQYDEALRSGG